MCYLKFMTSTDDMWEDIAIALEKLDMSLLNKNDVEVYTRYFKGLLLDGVLQAYDGNQTEAAKKLGYGENFIVSARKIYANGGSGMFLVEEPIQRLLFNRFRRNIVRER